MDDTLILLQLLQFILLFVLTVAAVSIARSLTKMTISLAKIARHSDEAK